MAIYKMFAWLDCTSSHGLVVFFLGLVLVLVT